MLVMIVLMMTILFQLEAYAHDPAGRPELLR
jgi:hypothetical protein